MMNNYKTPKSYNILYVWLTAILLSIGSLFSNNVNAQCVPVPIGAAPWTYNNQSFDTTCAALSTSACTLALPSGWSSIITAGAPTYPWVDLGATSAFTGGPTPALYGHTGNGLVGVQCYNNNVGNDVALVSPSFSLSSISGAQVSFWMARHIAYTGYKGTVVKVYINTSPNLTGAMLIGQVNSRKDSVPTVAADGWYQYFFGIPSSYSGTTNYILFNTVSDYYNNPYLDDISVVVPPNMSYLSTTAAQLSSAAVASGSTNNQIIAVPVVTNGGANPLSVTSLTFNTTGTTLAANITSAKVYYTGTTKSFSSATQFGTTVSSPSGSFTINGTQSITSTQGCSGLNDTSYFWLAYDISPTAATGNFVNAAVTSVTVGGIPRTPAIITNPGAGRQILGPMSGNYNVGTSGPATYSSITNAMGDLNARGVAGPVTLTLIDNLYSGITSPTIGSATGEIFPITIGAITGMSPINTVKIVPSATATPIIIDSNTSSMFIFNGAKYFTIDGRRNAADTSQNISIENMHTSGSATIVQFINDCKSDVLRNCVLRGANNSYNYSQGGMVIIGGTTAGIPFGNDSILIRRNLITRSQYRQFSVGIFSNGQSALAQNDAIVVDSNYIYGYNGNYPGSSYASAISFYGGTTNGIGNGIIIRGNSMYDTAYNIICNNASYNDVYHICFYAGTLSNNDTIAGNIIGGNTPNAPEGVYGNRMRLPTNTSYNYFYGIYTYVGSGGGVVIADNKIRSLSFTPTSTSYYMYYYPVYHVGGTVQVGYQGHGNIFGSLTDTNSINFVGGYVYNYGVYISNSSPTTVSYNTWSNQKFNSYVYYYPGVYISGSGASLNVTNNTVRAISYTGWLAYNYWFYIGSSHPTQNITNNTFGGPNPSDSISKDATSSGYIQGFLYLGSGNANYVANNKIQGIYNYYPSHTPGTSGGIIGIYNAANGVITGNKLDNFRSYGIGSSGLIGIYNAGGTTISYTYDTLSNFYAASTYTGTTTTASINGILNSSSNGSFTIDHCLLYNFDNNQNCYQVNGIYCSNTNTGGQTYITNNTIRNIRSAGYSYASGGIVGIYDNAATSYPNQVISGNTIHSLVSYNITAGTPSVIGIISNTSSALTGNVSYVTKNNIHSFNVGTASTNATMYGIWNASGSSLYANNMIRLGRDTAGNAIATSTIIKGIYQSTSGALINRYLHNTVYIDAAPTTGAATQITSAFELTTAATAPGLVDVRNNIFANNTSNSAGTSVGLHYVARFPANATNYLPIANLNSNYNVYSCQSATNVYFSQVGAANQNSIFTHNAAAMVDGASGFSFTLPFNNATGNYSTVNLRLTSPNSLEGSGDSSALTYVTDDFDGNARSGLTPTDIGASAANSTLSGDIIAPGIIYTPLPNTSSISNITFTANIFDKGGLPIGPNAPRVYYKKTVIGTWYSSPGTLVSGNRINGNWSFTINNSVWSGVVPGDSIYYFVTAQDSLSSNLNGIPMYANGSSVNVLTVNPMLPNSYLIAAPFPSTVTVGPGGMYNSFTETGALGLFNAINTGSVSGNISVQITGNITETGAVQLNPWVESGAGAYTITIRPQSNTQVVLSGSVANTNGLIRLNGVSRVNILGYSPTGTVADTNLIIRSSSTSTPALGFLNGGGYDTLMNVILESRTTTNGVVFISGTTVTTGLNNVLIKGCYIHQDMTSPGASFPTYGIYAAGTVPRLNNNIWLVNNKIYNFGTYGIYATTGNGNGWIINGNHLFENTLATWTQMYGIYFTPGSTSDNNTINGNWIGGMAPYAGGNPLTLSSTFYGIYGTAGIATGTTINNNVISNLAFTAANTATQYAIYAAGSGAIYTINNNRIGNLIPALSINSAGNQRIYGIYSSATGNVSVQNDSIMNINMTNVAGASVGINGIFVTSGASNTTIINNNYLKSFIMNSASTGVPYSGAGSICGIFLGSTSITQSITNNWIQTLVNINATAAHSITGIAQYSAGAVNINNNMIYGISSKSTSAVTGSYTSAIFGIQTYSSTQINHNYMNNTIDSIWLVPTTPTTSQIVGIYDYYALQLPVIMTGNIVRNINTNSTAGGTAYGASIIGLGMYYGYYTANGNISNNQIYNLQNWNTTSAHWICGIMHTSYPSLTGNNTVVNGNSIYGFKSASTVAPRFDGIYVYNGYSSFTNNMIRLGVDSSGTAITNPTVMNGITLATAYQNNFYHNTIMITGAPTSGAAQTAAFLSTATIPNGQLLDIRNNIFVNTTSNGGTATGFNYGMKLVDSLRLNSNYNLFNVNGLGGYVAATNYANYPTLGGAAFSWQGSTKLDLASASGDPNFNANALGSSYNFQAAGLAVQNTTPIEKSGDPSLTSVATDYFGNARSSMSPSDVGAHAGNFSQSPDLFPPVISFSTLTPSGTLTGTRTLSNVVITDNNGIPMTGANRPKIYYAKTSAPGTWYSSSSTTLTGSATNAVASFGIDYTPMLPLTTADTIMYYVIAQDNAGNTMSNAPYAVATNVSAVASNPVTPNWYNFLPVIPAGTVYQVGAGQTFTSLTGVGGFFDFINSRTLGGNISAEITSNLLGETGAVALNLFGEDGAGAGTYTLTIRPDATTSSVRTIEGNVGGNGLVVLNSANRVKITGVPTGGLSTLKYLLFRNTSMSAPIINIRNGSTGVRINNCIIEGSAGAVSQGSINLVSPTGLIPCSFDTISGCVVRNDQTATLPNGLPYFAFYTNGNTNGSGVFNNNIVISGNEFANYYNSGIVMDLNNGNNWTITGNSFYYNLYPFNPVTTQFIALNDVAQQNSSGNVISGNFVGGSAANCGGSPWTSTNMTTVFYGLRVFASQGVSTLVQNNTIKNINFIGNGTSAFYGIYGGLGNIVIGGGPGLGNTVGDVTVNNSIVNTNSATHYGIYYSSTNNITVSYNTVAGLNLGQPGYAGTFYGVYVGNGNVLGVNNNTIGSASVTNSITNNGINYTYGIYCNGSAQYTLNPYTVSNNTISNIYGVSNFGGAGVFGINLAGSQFPTVANNTIYNLTTNSTNFAFSGTGAVQGIQMNIGSNAVATITNNTVYGLRALNTGAVNPCVFGIICVTGQSPVINANRIYDLTNASTSTTTINNVPVISGICLASSPQISAVVTNNQVTLGSGTSYNTQIDGIWLQYGNAAFTLNAFNNSVFITGTAAGNQSSFAFARSNNSGGEMGTWVNLRNNIFANNRTSGTGNHFAIANLCNSPTNNYWNAATSQYNLLVSASASTIGGWGLASNTLSSWIANSTSDANSYAMVAGVGAGQLNLANLFTAPASGNLGIITTNVESWYVYGKGITGSQINNLNNDYVGTTRSTIQGYATTLGSMQLASVPSMLPPAATASAAPVANASSTYSFAGRNFATVNWGATVPSSANAYNYTGVTPANAPTGNSLNQYIRLDLGSTGTYPYGAMLNYDIAMTGAVNSGANLKISTATSSSAPVWTTNPVSTVNTSLQTVTAAGMTTTTNTIMLTGTENNVAPTILSFNPSSKQVGGAVTIYGRSFVTIPAVSSVSFNGTAATPYTVVNDTTITTTVPVGATTGTVSITNAYGTGTSAGNFTVIQPPTVASFTPTTGTIGTTVTITGTNFNTATQVQVNATTVVSYTIVNSTTITATVPSGATTGNISVTNPAGTANSSVFGTFTVIQAPTVTTFLPTSGAAGATITLTGTNYVGVTAVSFNGTAASYTVNSSTSISVTVPNGATTGTIAVTNGSGTGTSTSFTVLQVPTITSFTPTSGGIGTVVTISGTNFTGATAVSFNSIAASTFTVNSSTQITATVNTGTNTGAIAVTTPSGVANSGSNFTVIPDLTVSTVTSLSGTYNNVTITATGNLTLNGSLLALGSVTVNTGGKLNTNGFVVNGSNSFTLNTGAMLTVTSAAGISSTGNLTGDIQMSGTRTFNAGATYVYAGTAAQVTGNGLPAATDTVVINNINGVSLSQATTINKGVVLGAGNLNLGNNNLTIAPTGNIYSASATGYVATLENATTAGSLKRTVTSGGAAVVFPVGSATWTGSYNPATITQPTGTTDVFAVRVFRGVLTTGTTGTPIATDVVNRSWVISEAVVGSSNATVQVQWQDTMENLPFTRTATNLPYHNGTTWNAAPLAQYTAASGTNPYTRSRAGITTFGASGLVFVVADNTTIAALPVELINFAGVKVNNDVVLNWQTVSEMNNSHFEVERSFNNIDFATIGKVEGAGNSNVITNYNFLDENIVNKNQPVIYYRLKQVDLDGQYSYSSSVVITISKPTVELSVNTYPNPIVNEVKMNVTSNTAGNMNIIIFDMSGKAVSETNVYVEKGIHQVTIENLEGLTNGIYLMNVTLNGNVYRQKLVK